MALAAAFATLGCGGGDTTPAPAASSDTVVGSVRLAGSTPLQQVMIQPADSSSELTAVGPHKTGLENLEGARVRVWGTVSDGRVSVTDYEILEIRGHVPLVGELAVRDSQVVLRTDPGQEVRLLEVPKLLTLDGARVWVILDSTGVVNAYGVIRQR